MKLAYLTQKFPFEPAEQFFEPEVRALSAYAEVYVVAIRPRTKRVCFELGAAKAHYVALLDGAVVRAAWRELRRDPAGVAKAFRQVAFGRSSLRARAVNLLTFPKALALAQDVRRLEIEHIHAQWLTSSATVGYVASLLTGVPFSISAHQHDIFFDNLVTLKVERARFVRVISERNRTHLQCLLRPDLRARCTTVHLGVELPAASAATPVRNLRILCPARLCEWKGHRYLLAALALLRERGLEFTCDLAGEGAERAKVAALIRAHGLHARVAMLGNVPHAMLLAALDRGDYDAIVLASTERPGEHEGIPVALIEAMAAGLPVVATRTGSVSELVDADNGILVAQRDPGALAAAIERLASDDGLRRQLGQRGRERVGTAFSSASTTRRLAQLLGAVPVGFDHSVAATPAAMGPSAQIQGSLDALAAAGRRLS